MGKVQIKEIIIVTFKIPITRIKVVFKIRLQLMYLHQEEINEEEILQCQWEDLQAKVLHKMLQVTPVG